MHILVDILAMATVAAGPPPVSLVPGSSPPDQLVEVVAVMDDTSPDDHLVECERDGDCLELFGRSSSCDGTFCSRPEELP